MDRQNIWLLMTVAVVSVIGLVTLQVGMPSLGSENIAGEAIYLSGASASSYSPTYAYATKLNPATATTISVTTTASASSIEESRTGLSISPEDVIAIVSTSRFSTSCFDTDGGLKPALAGRTHIIEHDAETGMGTPILTETDYCYAGLTSLWEWRCESGRPKKELVDCAPYGGPCLTDSDGRSYCEATSRCVDSDDGENPLVPGDVKIFESGIETGGAQDSCKSTTMVTEMVCGDKGVVTKVNVDCTTFGGICQYNYKRQAYCSPVTSCSDSDEGDDPDVAGGVTITFTDGKTEVIKDACKWGATKVIEYSCGASDIPIGEARDCPLGCLTDAGGRGHCRGASEASRRLRCMDTDGGLKPALAGRTHIIEHDAETGMGTPISTETDYCYAGLTSLWEWRCESGGQKKELVDCAPYGGSCLTDSDGRSYCGVAPDSAPALATAVEELAPAPEELEPSEESSPPEGELIAVSVGRRESAPAGECTDSDGHLALAQFGEPGYITTDTGTTNDACDSPSLLIEQLCWSGTPTAYPVVCNLFLPGTVCLTNAAGIGYCGVDTSVSAAPCSDSDAHLPTERERFETPGIVMTSTGVPTVARQFQDSCTGDTLDEQWCMGDSKQVLPFDCTRLGRDYECLMRAMVDGSRVGYCGSMVSRLAVVESGEPDSDESEDESTGRSPRSRAGEISEPIIPPSDPVYRELAPVVELAEEEPEEEEPTETLIMEPTLREIIIDWLIFWR